MSLTKERAAKILAAFSDKRVLVVGDAFVDTKITCVIERPNPENQQVPLGRIGKNAEEHHSGGAGNAARNIANLGGQATLLSLCGSDELGKTLHSIAKMEGYAARFVTDKLRSTINKCRFVTKRGVLFRADYEDDSSTQPMEDTLVPLFAEHLRALLKKADGLLISDYGKGLLTRAWCDRLLDEALHAVPILADVKPAQAGHFIGVNMMSPNLKEATEAVKMQHEQEVELVAAKLAEQFNTEAFLTAGDMGICIAKEPQEPRLVRQEHIVEVGDTSGCGDTAAATILLAKLCGATSVEAAELANAAAAVTVSKVGAYAPKPEEVLRMLAS